MPSCVRASSTTPTSELLMTAVQPPDCATSSLATDHPRYHTTHHWTLACGAKEALTSACGERVEFSLTSACGERKEFSLTSACGERKEFSLTSACGERKEFS